MQLCFQGSTNCNHLRLSRPFRCLFQKKIIFTKYFFFPRFGTSCKICTVKTTAAAAAVLPGSSTRHECGLARLWRDGETRVEGRGRLMVLRVSSRSRDVIVWARDVIGFWPMSPGDARRAHSPLTGGKKRPRMTRRCGIGTEKADKNTIFAASYRLSPMLGVHRCIFYFSIFNNSF